MGRVWGDLVGMSISFCRISGIGRANLMSGHPNRCLLADAGCHGSIFRRLLDRFLVTYTSADGTRLPGGQQARKVLALCVGALGAYPRSTVINEL